MPLWGGAPSGVGAHREPYPVGGVAVGRPDLLPVDDIVAALLVPHPYGAGLEGGQVGAGVRFAVADGEVDLAGEDPGQEVGLLFVGAELHDRRADGVQRHQRQRHPGLGRLVEEDELFRRGHTAPAELLGPADAEPAVRAQPADGLAVEALLRRGAREGCRVRARGVAWARARRCPAPVRRSRCAARRATAAVRGCIRGARPLQFVRSGRPVRGRRGMLTARRLPDRGAQ